MSSLPVLRETADEVRLFDPSTGAELDLPTAPTDQLAEMRAYIRDLEEDLKLAKQALDAEIITRMDTAVRWSWVGGGYTLTAPSPAPTLEFDGQQLHTRLAALAAQGIITWDAVAGAVDRHWAYKPKVAGINRLRKLGGVVAETIAECETKVEKVRRVTLGRAS